MKKFRLSKIIGIVLVFCTATAITASAQTLTTLYRFCPQTCPDGAQPYAGLVQATDGNFYGTTRLAGPPSYGPGTVFKITSSGMLTTLHNFSYFDDGGNPEAVLVQATDGNFYGTTSRGGAEGAGAVFKVTSEGTLTSLYSFCVRAGCADGSQPVAGLAQGSDGNFYGTTWIGGDPGPGTVFKITPSGVYTTLYSFCSQPNCADGEYVYGGLVRANDGSFYGTTALGGAYGEGTVFKITSSGTLTTLHSFCAGGFFCADGADPQAALIQATDGNFYGTTQQGGGTFSLGTVFKITPSGTLTTLHSFCPAGPPCTDGYNPVNGLVQATDGNFYGMTGHSGDLDPGTIFQITPDGRFVTLYTFHGPDGAGRGSTLVQATDGNFYGTTMGGGISDQGTVFRLSLPVLVPTTTVLVTEPNPSNLGQPVTITATVTAQDHSIPIGTVMFKSNDVIIGSASLNGSGVAVLIYAGLSLGTDRLQATYEGSEGFAGSISNTVLQLVGVSNTTVTSAPNPSMFGDTVTITATVGPSGPPAPTGTVSFTSNGTAIPGCTAVPLTSQLTAVCTTSTLAVGTDAIVATYSGDANYSGSSGTLSQLVNPIPSAVQFVAVTPCRLVDTRQTGGAIPGGSSRDFPVQQEGGCNIPATAAAYSLNVTVVPQGPLGYLTIWPTGEGRPVVSTLNSADGRVKANAAIVPAGTSGDVSVYVTDTTNVILDIDGYFAPVSGSTLAFYPLTPCRVADTRYNTYPPGLGPPSLTGGQPRAFPILNATTTCNIPTSGVAAYSLNFTVVPHGTLGYLTVWPTGETQPTVSTLNDVLGWVIANAAIVVAGSSGEISAYATDNTDLIIDIDGYFAPAGAGGLSLYAVAPCRVIDTRHVGNGQPFTGTLTPPVDVEHSQCGPPATAQAYVFNATVIPPGSLGYLTLWPDGALKPLVSTLNAADGSITNNMAIVPSTNGKVDAYASGLTQLILDISSYFAP